MVAGFLALRCPASADDTAHVIVTLRPDDQNETAGDGPDGKEAILRFGMDLVEDLEVIGPGREELPGLLEGDAVPPPVVLVLAFIPGALATFGSIGAGLSYVNGLVGHGGAQRAAAILRQDPHTCPNKSKKSPAAFPRGSQGSSRGLAEGLWALPCPAAFSKATTPDPPSL